MFYSKKIKKLQEEVEYLKKELEENKVVKTEDTKKLMLKKDTFIVSYLHNIFSSITCNATITENKLYFEKEQNYDKIIRYIYEDLFDDIVYIKNEEKIVYKPSFKIK